MALVIPNTPTQNDYVASTTFAGTDVLAHGYFLVANAGVFARMLHGIHGQAGAGEEGFFPPGIYPLKGGNRPDPIAGIQFRSAVAGTPAQVSGVIYYPGEASIGQGTQFQSEVTGGGGVVPPVSGIEASTRIERTSDQAIPNNVLTAVIYESVRFDYGDLADLAAQPTRITIPAGADGRYVIVAGGVWAAPAGGGYFHFIRLNGATFVSETAYSGAFAGNISYSMTGVWDCVAGDFFETIVLQNSGAPQNLLGSALPRIYMAALRQAS